MYILKLKNLLFTLLVLGIFLSICMPNSIKTASSFEFFNVSFLFYSIIYIPFFIFSIKNKYNKLTKFILIYCSLNFLIAFVADSFLFQRFFLGTLFFVPYFIINSIKWDIEKIKILKFFAIFSFFFLSFQIILSSLGILKFNDSDINQMGDYIRVGTTAGVATFTAPVILILFSISYLLFKNEIVKIIMYIFLFINIFLLGTRSALIIFCIYTIYLYLFRIKFKYKVLFIFILMFFGPNINEKFKIIETIELRSQTAMESTINNDDITTGRIERWGVVLQKIKNNPEILFTGVGGANTPYFNRYIQTELKPTASPHNVYLAVLYEHGVFSLFLFLYILFLMVKKVMFSRHKLKSIFILLILITFNTEVIPLNSVFSSLFLLFFTLLTKEKVINILDTENIIIK